MEFCKSAQEEVKLNRKLSYPLGERKERLRKIKLIQRLLTVIKTLKIIPFYVKDCGMVKKKRAKRTKNVLQCPMC